MPLSKDVLQRIAWDWRPLEDVAQERLDARGLTEEKIAIYRKLLMSARWYELLDMLTAEQLREALDERVLKTLWPAGVKKKYTNAARLLPHSALSAAG